MKDLAISHFRTPRFSRNKDFAPLQSEHSRPDKSKRAQRLANREKERDRKLMVKLGWA